MAKKKSKDDDFKLSDEDQFIIDEIDNASKPLKVFHKDPIPSEIESLKKSISDTDNKALLLQKDKNTKLDKLKKLDDISKDLHDISITLAIMLAIMIIFILIGFFSAVWVSSE